MPDTKCATSNDRLALPMSFIARAMPTPPSSQKPLDFICPCGYRKKIPASFNGKKVVCPKCHTALKIRRMLKTASVLIRCPYCKINDEYSPDNNFCIHCEREYELPDVVKPPTMPTASPTKLSQQTRPAPQFAPQSAPVAQSVDVQSQQSGPAINTGATSVASRRKKGGNNLLSNLFGIVICGLLGFLVWDKFGERLGLPPIPGMQTNNSIVGVPVKDTNEKPKSPPKLTSPSIEILDIVASEGQGLDQVTSEVVEPRLSLEINLKNLSECEITRVQYSLQFLNGEKKLPVKKFVQEFTTPKFQPNTVRTSFKDFPIQDITGVKVSIFRVWADDQSDAKTIEKTVDFPRRIE